MSVPVLDRTNECRRLLDSFKIKDIRFLASDSKKILLDDPNESRNYWCDLIHDIFLTKTFIDDDVKKIKKKRPKYMFFIDFINKGFDYIKLASILHDTDVIATLPEKLQDDEVPSIVYILTLPVVGGGKLAPLSFELENKKLKRYGELVFVTFIL